MNIQNLTLSDREEAAGLFELRCAGEAAAAARPLLPPETKCGGGSGCGDLSGCNQFNKISVKLSQVKYTGKVIIMGGQGGSIAAV
jgi:hypothetical protein